jgi:transcriptional regulator GlxA family with amidase domain
MKKKKFLRTGVLVLVMSLSSWTLGSAQGKTEKMNVAIFVYSGVEILDFGGPAEVFASAYTDSGHAFNVYTVAASSEPVRSQNFLTIVPEYSIHHCPAPDIMVLPGGSAEQSAQNEDVLAWVKGCLPNAKVVMSVCTGAIILAKAGLLDGKVATTWHGKIDYLRKISPHTTVLEKTRFVDNGRIITTAGVSAGIDGALHVVARMLGENEAARIARYMEYDMWKPGNGKVMAP